MNDAFKRRLVGLLTLAALALLLSWLLPRPGLRKLAGTEDRVAAMDLTKPGSPAEELLPDTTPLDAVKRPKPKPGSDASTLFPLPADPGAADRGDADDGEPPADAVLASAPAKSVAETAAVERIAAEEAASTKAIAEKSAAAKLAADKAAADRAAAQTAVTDKAAADKAAAERLAAQKASVEKATADRVAADKTVATSPGAPPSTQPAVATPAKPPVAPSATPPVTMAPAPSAPATPPSKPAPVAAKPAPAAGTWYAQCGVYSMLENAQTLRDELAKRGLICDMAPVEAPKGTMYRVRCGPFKTRGEADIVVSRISDRVQAIVVDGAH